MLIIVDMHKINSYICGSIQSFENTKVFVIFYAELQEIEINNQFAFDKFPKFLNQVELKV